MLVPKTVWIGIVLTLAGPLLLCCAILWLAPHPQVALEMPVSLSPGHINTGNFRVNPDSLYHIDIEFDERSPVRADCEPRVVRVLDGFYQAMVEQSRVQARGRIRDSQLPAFIATKHNMYSTQKSCRGRLVSMATNRG